MESHRFYLQIAMQEAEIAFRHRTYPVGAVIAGPDGEIIGQGHNLVYNQGVFTSHAEIEAIRKAEAQLMREQNFEQCTLYTTLEPCLMCCGAIIHARIKRVIWIKDDDTHGALRDLHNNANSLSCFYVSKFGALEISHASEDDLASCMYDWMNDWNSRKEAVLSKWQRGYMQGSSVEPPLLLVHSPGV